MWRSHFRKNGYGYLFAIFVSAISAAIAVWAGTNSLKMLQVLAVLLASWSGGLFPGLLATALCLLADTYLFYEPRYGLMVDDPRERFMLLLLAIVGCSIAVVNEVKKRAFEQEDRRRRELQVLMSSIGEGVIAVNLSGEVVSMNRVAERLTGWTASVAARCQVGEVFRETFTNSGRPKTRSVTLGETLPDLPGSFEFGSVTNSTLVSKDGQEYPVEVTSAPIHARNGKVTGLVLVFRDVSHLRLAEQQQRQQDERFRALIQATAEVVWTTDATGNAVEDSPTWRAFTGQTVEQWRGSGWLNAIHPDDRSRAELAWMKSIREKIPYQLDYRLQAADGSYRWTTVRSVPVFDPSGSVREWVGMNVDITSEHLVMESLKASENRYQSIFEASHDGLIIYNSEGSIVEANPGACQMHGYQYEELVGKSGSELIEADSTTRHERFFARVSDGQPFFDRGRHLREDGTLIDVEVQGSSLNFKGQPHLLTVVRDVSERRAAEKKLLDLSDESERQRRLYDTILSNSVDQVYVFDLDHNFSYANQALLKFWGKSWNQVIGRDCRALGYSPQQAQQHDDGIDQVIANKKPIRGEIAQRGSHGRRIYDYILYPVLGIEGEVEAVAATSRDVTDRKKIENNLRHSEQRFRQMADAMPQIVWTATPNGYIDYYNQRWYEFTGFDPDQRGIEFWEDILHPEDVVLWKDYWSRSVSDGTSFDIEFRLRNNQTGSYEWFLGKAVSIKDEFGDVVRWFGTFTDINRQKRNEQVSDFLAEASSKLVEQFSGSGTMEQVARIAVPHFCDWCAIDLLESNGECQRVALVHSEPIPANFQTELNEIYPPQFDSNDILWRALRDNGPQLVVRQDVTKPIVDRTDIVDQQDKQARWLRSLLCVPLSSPDRVLGTLTFGMAGSQRNFDVDDLHAAIDTASRFTVAMENSNLYQQLRESDRRKDEFLAMLAHELRNPLAPIRTGLELLIHDHEDDRPVLQVMQDQVEHLVRLVDDLLDVSRIMRGKIGLRLETVDLTEIVERAVSGIGWAFAEKGQSFHVHTPSEPVPVHVDPVRLVQVISNLLSNATKYTPEEGEITLRIEPEERSVRIVVKDDGVGIEDELLPSIFDLFTQSGRTLDRSQGGLGIGLTLVRSLVEMHDGTVQVFSAGVNSGSEFVVELPISQDALDDAQIDSIIDAGTGRRILIVDDNLAAAKLLNLLLRKLGPHEIQMAHDGPEALKTLEQFDPELILLDIGLPEMDGYEVVQRIRSNPAHSETLVVALTGYGRDEDRRRSFECGFDDHLVKPPSLAMIQEVLQHPRLSSPLGQN